MDVVFPFFFFIAKTCSLNDFEGNTFVLYLSKSCGTRGLQGFLPTEVEVVCVQNTAGETYALTDTVVLLQPVGETGERSK